MVRRAVVIRIAGDAEIGAAIRDGIEMRRKTPSVGCTDSSLTEGALTTTQVDPAKLEADAVARRWLDGRKLSLAVGNDKGPEDYELMITRARGNYAGRANGPLVRGLWSLVGLIVLGVERFFAWEEMRWREG